ncbi:hypothetical protein CRYUN_Cryun09bG0148100 [Craigia yunnanensis]
MALQHSIHIHYWASPAKQKKLKPVYSNSLKLSSWNRSSIGNGVNVYGMVEKFGNKFMGQELSDSGDDDDDDDDYDNDSSKKKGQMDDSYHFDADERHEADPDWPEDADGRGFNLGQFFDKITIKNVKKDNEDGDCDSENEVVWQDDNYIRPIKRIKTAQWEATVFKDISPLIILVHNRYKRYGNSARQKKKKGFGMSWRKLYISYGIAGCLNQEWCIAVDAVVEDALVSSLKLSVFPEIIFTKAGKIFYREQGIRTADELSQIMAFFYYGAAKPPCVDCFGNSQEMIPSVVIKS